MEAERRQVTVLFTDLVGFTTYSERSGEEAAFTLMRSLSKLMDEAVRGQGGTVQGFTGDGILAVFGAPLAFEDAPLRACRAALAIDERLKSNGADLEARHGIRPQLRIGLNTGPAVVGQVQGGADSGVTVLGDTVNVAARLQALAEPDGVVMSEATHRLVQGMVAATFAGEYAIKGKSAPQRVFRLDAIRQDATRFDAAVSRGLGTFVGRDHELKALELALGEAGSEMRVIDIAADPGIGKSRLLYEFRQRIGKERAFVLAGSCSPEGQQTPFLPFIEVARGAFGLAAVESESEVARKLEMGLTALGLHSHRNLGLLLHLLGLRVPDGALTGLDGVLIGLRTRELLQQLLEARCRLSPVLLLFEDLHWIDSGSEELLSNIIDRQAKLRLLVVMTRRPEYVPRWFNLATVTELRLDPLPISHIRSLFQSRLGVDALPQALARHLTEKADGNPLFAEEIVSFLTERGIVRAASGELTFDASAVAAVLPASIQGLLTARVDQLALKDRALLQAASVIGRQFDPDVLATVAGKSGVEDRLAAMQGLDLIRFDGRSGEYAFKHALVQDTLYQSLLSEPRKALHLAIAEEIERRSGNRLTELAEILARHYGRADRANKAFTYLSMAGSKSLSVYSLDEATSHFNAALALLDNNPACVSEDQVADFLVNYVQLLNLSAEVRLTIAVLTRHLSRLDGLGDDRRIVLIRHYFVSALYGSARYVEMPPVQQETSLMANRLADARSKAYSLAGDIMVSTVLEPKPIAELERIKEAAITAASATTDAHLQNWIRFLIGWEEFHRGRIRQSRHAAHELIQVGQSLKDPRSMGLGLALLTWIALVSDSYVEALEYAEHALAAAVTPFDDLHAAVGKGCALVLLRRTQEGLKLLEGVRGRCFDLGFRDAFAGSDVIVGLGKVFQGNVGSGIRFLEEAISAREKELYRDAADWYRMFLSEVYLQILQRNERFSFLVLVRNMPTLLKASVTGSVRIRRLVKHVLENPHFDPAGHMAGRAKMVLGLLYKKQRRPALADQYLTEAREILSQFGQTPILARVDTALAELG